MKNERKEYLTAYQKLKDKIYIFLSIKPRTNKEITNRLSFYLHRIKNISHDEKEQLLSNITSEIRDYGFINDERYTKQFVAESLGRSKITNRIKVKSFLLKKGVSEDIIDESLKLFTEDVEKDQVTRLVHKKLKVLKEENHFSKKRKLIKYLVSKGYRLSVCRSVVDSILDVK